MTCPNVISKEAYDFLRERYEMTPLGCDEQRGVLLDKIKKADGLIMGGKEKIDSDLLEESSLKWIVFIGVQPETFFEPDAWEYFKENIYKTGGGENEVAMRTFKQLTVINPFKIQFAATKGFYHPKCAEEIMKDQALLIVGAGNIGKKVMNICAGQFLRVSYAGGRGEKEELKKMGYTYINDLKHALGVSHVASIHLSFVPGVTENSIDYEMLSNMPRNGFLVNNSRAGLVEPEGLLKLLKVRKDVLCIFDTFYVEGSDFVNIGKKQSPETFTYREIINQPNFVYTGHTAAMSEATRQEYSEKLVSLLDNYNL